jgi:hypothetical protein
MNRTAQCQCGALRVDTESEPLGVLVCHCTGCQQRTGSAFGFSAYFRKGEVKISGEFTTWERKGETGNSFKSNFRPTCGAAVFWHLGMSPGVVGVAAATFGDRAFPAPQASIWEEHAFPWAVVTSASEHLPRQS